MKLSVACKSLTHSTPSSRCRKVSVPLFRSKTSSCKSNLLSSLQTWHDIVAKVPISEILPTGFGNKSGIEVKESAWYGDKLIGEQVASQLHKFLSSMKDTINFSNEHNHKEIRRGMHVLYNMAVSNQRFADELKLILPSHATRNVLIVSKNKVHDAGTMVEAAVSAVSNLSEPQKYESIATLAKYLIFQAAQGAKFLPSEVNEKLLIFVKAGNTKDPLVGEHRETLHVKKSTLTKAKEAISEHKALSFLNQYGGKVDCMDLCTTRGSNKNQVSFYATATLNGISVSSKAFRKKLAKRQAAYFLLKEMEKAQFIHGKLKKIP